MVLALRVNNPQKRTQEMTYFQLPKQLKIRNPKSKNALVSEGVFAFRINSKM
jgi:hypothetical protein